MKFWIFFFTLPVCSFFGSHFIDLSDAKSGDYIVAQNGKMATVLAFRNQTNDSLILEEISAPVDKLKKHNFSNWIQQGAPGHTSWSMIEIDTKTGEILECYSFSKSSWVEMSQKESLIANLLKLPLQKLPASQRKKIGPPPQNDEMDVRKIWNPPLMYEGKKIEGAELEAYSAIWPKDDSQLSQQQVVIYLDPKKRSALPYWIQVETSHFTAAMQTIDSGKNLPSVHRTIPRRQPQFLNFFKNQYDSVELTLNVPKYYKDLELYIIDVTDEEKKIYPIDFTYGSKKGEITLLKVDFDIVKSLLNEKNKYSWLVITQRPGDYQAKSIQSPCWTLNNLLKKEQH